ncbi:zinc-dependent metalloprotease [Granulicoccus sp. GXG6511]|uniref:zinc-dependent metalloprotease n=1 Tax=Granulicoccus sp. GXG6511 TaxID=3381351 RepID=UPI003D7EE0C0
MMNQVRQMMSQMGLGGMFGDPEAQPTSQWEPIRDVARRVVAAQGSDPSTSATQLSELRDAVRLADTWLDGATAFPATGGQVAVWSRAEWVEQTMPTWRRLIEPVADAMSEAMADSMSGGEGLEGALPGLDAFLRPLLKSSGAQVFGLQAGQAIGTLAASVLSATEAGLPLSGDAEQTLALVPTNVAAFADGLDQSTDDIRLYLALREVARQRLFAATPWLGPQLLTLVESYARGIRIDLSSLESAMGSFDPTNLTPESMKEMSDQLQGTLFEPQQTNEQKAVLERLETLLALIEGWVDEVVAQATKQWMPSATALAETMRRRRATSGPTEATFQALVGLELRPRRLRDAANLWAALREARGTEGRDDVWNHPDVVPTAADLDDPLGFVSGERSPAAAPVDDLDAELARLLEQAEQERDAERRGDEEDRGDDNTGG